MKEPEICGDSSGQRNTTRKDRQANKTSAAMSVWSSILMEVDD
jgi:hypothetical protein